MESFMYMYMNIAYICINIYYNIYNLTTLMFDASKTREDILIED